MLSDIQEHVKHLLTFIFSILFVFVFVGCNNSTDTFEVVSVTPIDGSTDIPLNVNISASFNKSVDSTSVEGTSNFTLKKVSNSELVEGTITYNSSTNKVFFTPAQDLLPETAYRIILSPSIRSSGGINLKREFIWTFTTGKLVDTTAPNFDGLKDVATEDVGSSTVILRWNDASDNSSEPKAITYHIFVSTESQGQSYQFPNYQTAIGVNSYMVIGLTPGNTYYFVVLAKDESGNYSKTIIEKSVTTLDEKDTTPPTVVSTNPAEGAVNISVNTLITVGFSEDIEPGSLNNTTAKLSDSSGSITGTVNYNVSTRTMTFTPTTYLEPETTYLFTLTTGVKDKAGNALEREVSYSFLTGAYLPPDQISPVFAGAKNIVTADVSSSSITLRWDTGTDNITPDNEIVYLIYIAKEAGTENYLNPTYVTAPGVSAYKITGLTSNTNYYFVVLSQDRSGNISQTIREVSTSTNP